MELVAGLSLKNLKPRVWDKNSPHFLPDLRAVMISYADFEASPAWKSRAMESGLRKSLGIPDTVRIYLDNGAFYFARKGLVPDAADYERFVAAAKPDWYPIPHDVIPAPSMTLKAQRLCLQRTMEMNRAYEANGYVSVLHASRLMSEYIADLQGNAVLAAKPSLAVGGLVPNLLRAPKARPYKEILSGLQSARRAFVGKQLHVFGIGGTSTVHLAALMGFDSADSSGWRNRAARGIVQLPGSGDRMVASLGKWRGRAPSTLEWEILRNCPCPSCRNEGLEGLQASGTHGFSQRAAHNLWVLLEEAQWIEGHLQNGSYAANFRIHLDNTTYLPLIESTLQMREENSTSQLPARVVSTHATPAPSRSTRKR